MQRNLKPGIVAPACVSALMLLGAAPPREAASPLASSSNSTTAPVWDRRVHTMGDIWYSITNDGTFGAGGAGVGLDLLGHSRRANFEFPAQSRREHLFEGGLWVGGIVGDDTLLSAGLLPTSSEGDEWNGFTSTKVVFDSMRGYERFSSLYFDTMIPPSGPLDQASWRQHQPLGLQIDQISHAFASPPYDRFILVEYHVRNISRYQINKPVVGFIADCDVYHREVTGQLEDGFEDDVAGFLADGSIAYVIDNNGDPIGDSTWGPTHSRNVIGIAPIWADPVPCCTSFNWFATNYVTIDWGPRRATDRRILGTGGNGLPAGDASGYYFMANREKDYGQLFSALDMTAEGWKPPMPMSARLNLADGQDTRILLSFGFRDLAPNDSIRIVIAIAAGENVHTAPDHFARLFDPLNPQPFYETLDFSDLVRNVQLAR